jgi:hypothetical protein
MAIKATEWHPTHIVSAGIYGWWLVMATDPENGPAYTEAEWAAQVADTAWVITNGRLAYRRGNHRIGNVFWVLPLER